ncbi:MAG TPA: ferric reductase-like transmembrane domain-containing protein [Candidatus Acidoferrum sp.]|nr:ferric reductase-like transmembrane domain-containing protein [Candidatus Acidoferrum sp.]
MTITFLDLSAYIGLTAVGAITINMLLGVMMAFRYSPVRNWPHHRFNYFRLHNWTGYIALVVTILHPLPLLLNRAPKFRLLDIVYPVHSPQQPLENTIGAIALYIFALMVITSYFRIQLGRRTWKAFHFTIYLGAVALFYHSLFTDPDLQHHPVDWFDGGKVFVEICALVILVTSILRARHSRQKALHLKQASRQIASSSS